MEKTEKYIWIGGVSTGDDNYEMWLRREKGGGDEREVSDLDFKVF